MPPRKYWTFETLPWPSTNAVNSMSSPSAWVEPFDGRVSTIDNALGGGGEGGPGFFGFGFGGRTTAFRVPGTDVAVVATVAFFVVFFFAPFATFTADVGFPGGDAFFFSDPAIAANSPTITTTTVTALPTIRGSFDFDFASTGGRVRFEVAAPMPPALPVDGSQREQVTRPSLSRL